MKLTPREQKIALLVREDIKTRLIDVLGPPPMWGSDRLPAPLTDEESAELRRKHNEMSKRAEDVGRAIDIYCTFDFEL